MALELWLWRHPRPFGVAGRCIGQTDVAIDRRRAKRLAHRIRQAARRHGLARVVHTSRLARCEAVGRCLRAWGWRHVRDARLAEMDFGHWDGLPWRDIGIDAIDAWCADFAHHAPGGGESLAAFFERVKAWCEDQSRTQGETPQGARPVLIVAHAGWMQATSWMAAQPAWPREASQWPSAPAYGACRLVRLP